MIARRNKNLRKGFQIGFYFIWYGIGRFFIEALRTDSLMVGSLKMAQIVSIIMVVIGIIMFIITTIKCKKYKDVGAKENEIKC